MSKYHIVPACLAYTEDELRNFLERWQNHASHIHIDCVGEHYTTGVTQTLYWRRQVEILKEYVHDFGRIEFHIMDTNVPRDQILEIREALPNVLIFLKEMHHNVCPEITSPYILGDHFAECQDVLCMTIENIGAQGQPFAEEFKEDLVKAMPTLPFENIHLDGGMTPEVIKMLVEQIERIDGAASSKHFYFTVGSYLFGESFLEKYTELHNFFPTYNE